MPPKPLSVEDIMTPQEHTLAGSTPAVLPREGHPEDWYTPISLLTKVKNKRLSIEETIIARKERGHSLIGTGVAGIVGSRVPLVVSLADLDPETGQTLEDPVIGGVWNPATKRIEGTDQGQRLTEELYKAYEKYKMDLHLRPTSTAPEGQHRNNPEQR